MNENKKIEYELQNEEEFDFDELEKQLQNGIDENFADLESLKKEEEKIGSPEALEDTITSVIMDQVAVQIGSVAGEEFIKHNDDHHLDLRKEAHIQTTENFANNKIATHNTKIKYQQRYDDWQSSFKRDQNGNIVKHTDRLGREVETLNKGERNRFDKNRPKGSAIKNTQMDHTISAAEIIRDPAANAHLSRDQQEKFANSKANLYEMDKSLNQSKGDLSTPDWLNHPNKRGQKPEEIFDISKEKKDEMLQKNKEARKEYKKEKEEGEKISIQTGKQSRKEEAFRIGGHALKAAVWALLSELIKNIVGKLIKWLKSTEKSFETFLKSVKEAISTFIKNLKESVMTVGTTIASTVVTSIVGPVVATLQKAWVLIKEGGKTVKEAIAYISKPENQKKSFSTLMVEVGKIIVAGLTAMGALVLGEVIEKSLMSIPIFSTPIPALGSLASIIGIFLGAIVAGISGALILNLINTVVAKRQKQENVSKQVDKGNTILTKQQQVLQVSKMQVEKTKADVKDSITKRHQEAAEMMRSKVEESENEETSNNKEMLDGMNSILDNL